MIEVKALFLQQKEAYKPMQIAVIDFGIGNLRSVEQALSTVAPDANVIVTDQAQDIDSADRVVMPGQGAMGTWVNALNQKQLKTSILNAISEKPMLGICVGMQALFEQSEEDGGVDGLGIFKGTVRHFRNFHKQQSLLKIPQMGWNQVKQTQDHPLWHNIDDQAHFYFVHSYCANSSQEEKISYGQTDYQHKFIAAVAQQNIFAVQFHPEKSHNDGLTLLKNFTQWNS